MGKYIESNPEGSSPAIRRGPHPDYEKNLQNAIKFVDRVTPSLPSGLSVSITDSNDLKKSVLMVAWQSNLAKKVGNFAFPIFLHESQKDVNRKIEGVFNNYLNHAKKMLVELQDTKSASTVFAGNTTPSVSPEKMQQWSPGLKKTLESQKGQLFLP